MRLAIVIASLGAGGTERVVSLLASGWARAGHDVAILTWGGEGVAPHFPLDPRVRVIPLDLLGGGPRCGLPRRIWRRLSRVRQHLRGVAPDAVLSFGDRTNVIVTMAALGLRLPVIVSERNNPRELARRNGAVRTWLIRRSYRLAARVAIPTAAMAHPLEPFVGRPPAVVPNPVLPAAAPDSAEAPAPRPYLLCVGRMVRQKGHDLLIDAFARVAQRFPDWHLVLIGDGPERPRLEAQIAAAGLSPRIVLPGVRTDMERWLAHADGFVLPSRYEGFPNALCEAMASGRAVIAADCEFGPREIVHDGVDGLLVPKENVVALAQAMERLMADSALRERLGGAARAIVERFGLARVLQMWDAVIRDAIDRTSASRGANDP